MFLVACLGLAILLIAALPIAAEADDDSISTCLDPCHVAPGYMGPDVATDYLGSADAAGHRMSWSPRVIADTSGATLPKDSRMPCEECHVTHGTTTDSIYMFSTEHTGGTTITTVRQLCEGCHVPYDVTADPVVVTGLVLRKLPYGVAAHKDSSTEDCFDCHGSSGHAPQGHGGSDCSVCHGSDGSHAIHTNASDPRGPGGIACTDCHMTDLFPTFKSGTDANGDGLYDLSETDVCDTCHSPGGDYDGVDSTIAPSGAVSIGAKDHWDSQVYDTTSTVESGNERWCVGCHDGDEDASGDEPSLIDGVYAPPVAGDEDGTYSYGTGWGFYKTGHGAPSSTVLPSNGFDPAPGLECDDCHDYEQPHIDGERRTFTATDTPDDYRTGYRLDLVSGNDPMLVPRPSGTTNSADNYRLCTQSGCHDPYPFTTEAPNGTSTPSARRTNFWKDAGFYHSGHGTWQYNMHKLHLDEGRLTWAPDWGTSRTSGTQCVTCHNVHGSTRMAMIHDGSLISDTVTRTPGMEVYYLNDDVSTWSALTLPEPRDVTLAMSDAMYWRVGSGGNLCSGCHGGGGVRIARTLWKDYGLRPILDWTGEPGYENDGCSPGTTTVEGTFRFRVEYTDGNNDAPTFVTLRIDRNDDGDCADASETVTMDPVDPLEVTYYDGIIYYVDVQLTKAGDNTIAYHFEASDGAFSPSTSETRTVHVANAVPELSWTGDTGYYDDGVFPNGGTTDDTDYEFRITYRDADGEAPSGGSPLIYIDADDDGQFESGESATMTPMAGGDYTSGKRYTYTTKLTRQSDDTLLYRFVVSDGTDTSQTETKTVGVLQDINQAPVLTWTGEAEYVDDGVDPQNQAGGMPFYFRVEYADANNDAPLYDRVWIDLDDDGAYEADEKFAMDDSVTADDLSKTDGDYSNGEIYAKKVYVPYAGDGTLTYCFSFSDEASATGDPMDDGNPANDKTLTVFDAIDVPSEYGTIQAAIDAASTGQTVLVADGSYPENISFGGKDITVESVNGAGSTSIENTAGVLVTFDAGSDSTLRGFTISNGTTGVVSVGSDVTIQECVIDGMSAAGIQHDGAGGDHLVIEDTTISDNHPGIYSSDPASHVTLRRTEVTGNSVTGNGGGIQTAGSGVHAFGRWTLEDCTFSDNVASGSGGALYNTGSTFEMAVSDCVFEDNRANGGDGGAIALATGGGSNTFDRTIIRGNYASGDGGGIYRADTSRWIYTNCIFSGNYAGGDGGGEYRLQAGFGTTYQFCTFSGNSADRGGGLYIQNTWFDRLRVLSSIMYGDDARSSTTADEIDGGQYVYMSRVQYTDIYQDVSGFNYTDGNYTADPMFINPVSASSAPTSTSNYHIQLGSPCEGSADPSATVAVDIDSQTRPQGSAVRDSGADEIDLPTALERSFLISPPSSTPAGMKTTQIDSTQGSGSLSPADAQVGPQTPLVASGVATDDSEVAAHGPDATAQEESSDVIAPPQDPSQNEAPARPATIPAAFGLASIVGLALRRILGAVT